MRRRDSHTHDWTLDIPIRNSGIVDRHITYHIDTFILNTVSKCAMYMHSYLSIAISYNVYEFSHRYDDVDCTLYMYYVLTVDLDGLDLLLCFDI